MPKYNVRISYEEVAYVEVEAKDPKDAEEKAQGIIDNGEVEIENQFDEPCYEFEVEEIK